MALNWAYHVRSLNAQKLYCHVRIWLCFVVMNYIHQMNKMEKQWKRFLSRTAKYFQYKTFIRSFVPTIVCQLWIDCFSLMFLDRDFQLKCSLFENLIFGWNWVDNRNRNTNDLFCVCVGLWARATFSKIPALINYKLIVCDMEPFCKLKTKLANGISE